jgi:hypothetical protein
MERQEQLDHKVAQARQELLVRMAQAELQAFKEAQV